MIQDPVWEQSFPDVSGAAVRFVDTRTGKPVLAALRAREVAERREENERRRDELLRALRGLDLDPVPRLVARAARRLVRVPQLGRPAPVHQGARVRAAALLFVALGLLAAGCAGDDDSPAVRKGRNVAVSRSLEPQAGFFGEPVVARVEIVVDRRNLDPAKIRLKPRTFPYRPATAVAVERRDFKRYTRLRYEVTLRCLYYACLPKRVDVPGAPYRDQQVTRFKAWHVYYDDPAAKKKTRHLARVWWPNRESVSNLDLTNASVASPQFPGRVTLTPLPTVGYQMSPPLLAALLLLAAGLLLVYPAYLVRRRLASRRPPPPEPEAPLPPLEQALLLVEWARDSDDGEDRRKALEVVAFELDAVGREELADSARRVAWSLDSPSPDAADRLVEEVRGES